MTNTQKILEDIEFLREAVTKLDWLLEHKVITKKQYETICLKLSKPYM